MTIPIGISVWDCFGAAEWHSRMAVRVIREWSLLQED